MIFIILIIIIIIITFKNYKKQKETKEQIRNLELQKYYEELKRKIQQPKEIKKADIKIQPYKLNNNIFTNGERFFYKVLRDITNKMDLIIMTKVRLADIIHVCDNNYTYFNKIKAKHIDFVLIDSNGKIKLLIELDDKSHNNYDRQERDKFLNDIFKNLNINLLRIPAKYSYNIEELENKIKESL